MSEPSTDTKKWKNGLLKSSLPLEQLVAEVLAKKKFYVVGEYAYLRPNEHGVETEFSIDLEAFDLMPQEGGSWATLRCLVECKYNYPGVRWIFASHVNPEAVYGRVVTHFHELCTQHIDSRDLNRFDEELAYCHSGVELHADGNVNNQSIARALHQVRYALINNLLTEFGAQIGTWNEVDLAIAIFCPIVVTTSSLHVLKRDVSLEDFQRANALSEIATEEPSLVVSNDNGPQLDRYLAAKLADLYQEYPEIDARLKEVAAIKGEKDKILGHRWSFDHEFRFAPQNVLIVNYRELDKTLRRLRSSVRLAGRKRKRIAMLKRDLKAGRKWLESHPTS